MSCVPEVEEIERETGLHRVKVYRLNANGSWDDKGTGLITIQNLEQSAALGLVVIEEERPSETLLIHRMSKDLNYSQQEETIISWQDQEAASDIAISFQEAAACRLIWDEIQKEQGKYRKLYGSNGQHPMIDEIDGQQAQGEDMQNGYPEAPVELPAPDMGNLAEISNILKQLSPGQRDSAGQILSKDGGQYVRKILDCFRAAEDLEDQDSLTQCFFIVRSLILITDADLLEILFAESNVMDVVGVLEYDPHLPERGNHRTFLRDVVVFKEPVPIKNAELKAKIHQSYRLGYVRDVILPRTIDEGAYAALSSFMIFNDIEVLMNLIEHKEVFQDLVTKFRMSPPGTEAWIDIISFLSELAALSKHLTAANQTQLFDILVMLGLFEILTSAIKHGDEKVQGKATEVLYISLQYKPSLLREHLVGPLPKQETSNGSSNRHRQPALQEKAPQYKSVLFALLIGFLTDGAPIGIQEQVVEILRSLLGSADFERNDFLASFYQEYMPQLLTVIEKGADKTLKPGTGPSPQALNLIIEILCFCIYNHQFRIKYFILQRGVMEKVIKLLQRRERWLQCSAIRFIRACLSVKDEFYNRYMIRVNLFEPIVSVFVANGEKYNLLNSVILEMFTFIHFNGMRNLIDYFMETQYPRVEDVDYDNTFQLLKNKWEQMHERRNETGIATDQLQAKRLQRDPRAPDRDEESYFNEDEDDDEPAQQNLVGEKRGSDGVSSGMPLVDYDDEDSLSPRGGSEGTSGQLPNRDQPPKRMRFMEQAPLQNPAFSSSPPLLHTEPPGSWRHT